MKESCRGRDCPDFTCGPRLLLLRVHRSGIAKTGALVRAVQRCHAQVTLIGFAFAFEDHVSFAIANAHLVPKERYTQPITAQLLDGHEGNAQIFQSRTFPGSAGKLRDVEFVLAKGYPTVHLMMESEVSFMIFWKQEVQRVRMCALVRKELTCF